MSSLEILRNGYKPKRLGQDKDDKRTLDFRTLIERNLKGCDKSQGKQHDKN